MREREREREKERKREQATEGGPESFNLGFGRA